MKKILSVLLATLMLFSVLGVSASASSYMDYYGSLVDPNTQVILTFDTNGGTMKNPVVVYDTQLGWVNETGFSGTYIMLPQSADTQKVGHYVTLPVLTAPSGYQFDGWYCYEDGNTYAANGSYKIPAGSAGSLINFRAAYSPAAVEEDTMSTVFDILIKVFGAIAGIILYNGDTEKGVALFSKVLGALDF